MVNRNFALKSACFSCLVAILCLLLLAGCADTPWPSWLTGEPGENVLNAPRVVGTPPSLHDKSFPNLATVPNKPDDFSTIAERREKIRKMTADREQAQTIRERIESEPPPAPDIPPPFQRQQP
jgi:hypothetical protein